MEKKKKTGIARLLEFTGKYKILLGISMLLSGISAVVTLMPFVCIYYVVREIFKAAPDLMAVDYQIVIRYGWRAVAFALLGMMIYFVALMCSHIAAFHTARNMKSQVLHHLAQLPMGFFTTHTSGALRKIIDENAGQTEAFLAHQMPDLVGAYVTPIAIFIMLLAFDWRLGLLTLMVIVIGFGVEMKMMSTASPAFMKKYQDAQEDMNNEAVEYVRGISVVKVFGQTVHSFKSFYNSIISYRDLATAYSMSWQTPMTLFTTIINGIFLVLIPAGILFAANANDYKAFILSFIFYLIFTPACAVMLMRIMYAGNYQMIANESVSRIDALLDEKPLIEPKIVRAPKDNHVVYDNVSYSYSGTERLAVNKVSFTIPKGKTVALVGPSGGGKTTIATLLPRFFDVKEGSITIGGVDIREMALEKLMEQVAFVFQDSKLFKASLLDNIRFEEPEASEEEVMRAVKTAMCEDIIEKMPNGLNTVIGEKGIYLSGGEVQRIALARAILKDAPIIVLDEATAFADPENEYKIQKAFEKLTAGKTVLMIAHRLSTIRNASAIYVIENGTIAEQGTHDELVAQNGIYNRMWKDYQKSVNWTIKKTQGGEISYVS